LNVNPKKLCCIALCLCASTAVADEMAAVVVVGGARAPAGGEAATIGSRLDLTVRETPATLDIITRDLIEERGARTLDEAVRGAVGITQGGNATSPSTTSSRGFTAGFVSYLYDGTRVSVPTLSARVQDTWNIERVEVLKGPSSLMAGDGAIGGSINFVTKRPERERAASEALLSYGSFDTWRVGLGVNQPLGDSSALRLDYSRQQSSGHVERNRQHYDSLTLSSTTALSTALTLDLSLQLLSDSARGYTGTPLVPAALAAEPDYAASDSTGRVIDRRLASVNYNIDGATVAADSAWARAKLTWKLAPGWTLRDELSFYTADRHWRNAESYTFRAPRQVARDLVDITHDHEVAGNRLDLIHNGSLAGMKHRFAAGAEYTRTTFSTARTFSNGSAAAEAALVADAFAPVYGAYIGPGDDAALYAGVGNRTRFATRMPTLAVYLEDALSLTDRLTLVTGVRQDRVKLERPNTDLNTGTQAAYGQTYHPRSLRAGLVYALSAETTLYAQRSNAAAPVGSGNLLSLSVANAAFGLSTGKQSEIGVRHAMLDNAAGITLAAYRIELDNILTRDAAAPGLTVNSGRQSSKGLELTANWRPTRHLHLGGNASVLQAQYGHLIEAGNVSRAGKLPPNVPRKTANLWADYRLAGLPLKLGAALQYTGERYANNANTLRMKGYSTADIYASWRAGKGELTLRVRNLGDELYAAWTGANANQQVVPGAPRSADLTWHAKF